MCRSTIAMRADCFSSGVVAPGNGNLRSQLCHVHKRFVNHVFDTARRLSHATLTRQRIRKNHALHEEWSGETGESAISVRNATILPKCGLRIPERHLTESCSQG